MIEPQDERRGLPSASKLALIVRCPGSWKASLGLPPLPSDADAEYGDEVHAAWAGDKSLADLEEDKRWVVREADAIRERLIAELLPEAEPDYVVVETRYWLERFGEKVLSGRLDWARLRGGTALLLNLKSLYGEHAPVDENWQLLAEATLYHEHLKASGYIMDELYAGLIQPRVTKTPQLVKYTPADLDKAVPIIIGKLYEATDRPSPPRYAGAHCRHCPAAGVCVEGQAMFSVITYEPATPSVDRLTPEQMASILPKLNLYDAMAKAIRLRAKQALEANPDSIPGYELKACNAPLVINDAQGCYTAVKDLVTKDEFRQLLEIPIEALRTLFTDRYSRQHNTTLKAATEVFDKLIEPYSVRGPMQKRMVRSKE